MNSDIIEEFLEIYDKIQQEYIKFIEKSSKFPIDLLNFDEKETRNLPHNAYIDLFSSYAADMLVANRLCGDNRFSISDLIDCNDQFVQDFTKFTQSLEHSLESFTFFLGKTLKSNLITPRVFHILGERIVRREVMDSGAVFTPEGVVKLLTLQSLIFYLQKNSNLDIKRITKVILNPKELDSEKIDSKDLFSLYSLLSGIRVLDPACGTGLFCFEITEILFQVHSCFPVSFKQKSRSEILQNNVFGTDINPKIIFKLYFLLQLWLLEHQEEFLSVTTLKKNFSCNDSLFRDYNHQTKFHLVLGNPPYVRQENIRAQGIIQLLSTYTRNNSLGKNYKELIVEHLSTKDYPINKRSDLYIYFFYHAFKILHDKGIVSFLTSNSWLNIGFGFDFQEFIIKNAQICSIIDFDYRTFATAEINTVITTLCNQKRDESTNFCGYFINLNTSIFLENAPHILSGIFDHQKQEIKNFEEYTTPQFKLKIVNQGLIRSGTRWGNEILHAPRLYFKLQEKIGEKLIRLGEISSITRGITTGLNKFFILEWISEDEKEVVRVKNGYNYEFLIERKFLKPYLIGPKRMLNPVVRKEDLNHFLLCIPDDFKEDCSPLAADYIKHGKHEEFTQTKGKQKGNTIVGAHNIPTLKTKNKYYSINIPCESRGSHIFIQKIFSSKYKIYFTDEKSNILANNTFYNISLHPEFEEYSPIVISSLLSSITYFSIELNGRRSFGMGALDTAVNDIENIMIVDPRRLSNQSIEEMKSCVELISSREFLEVTEEVEKEDRRKLDKIILEHLNLSESQQELYNNITSLVQQRISKSQTYKRI